MKKQLATLLLAAALTLWALPASAQAAREGVQLETSGGSTVVTLTLPQETVQQGVTSLQLSFDVQGGDVKFDFADTLPATVKEYRCNDNTLTLYLSGRDTLLDSGAESVRLGEISVAKATQNEVTITFDPDSLQLLNAANGTVVADALPETLAVMPANGAPDNDQDGDQSGNQGSTGGSQNGGTGTAPTETRKPESPVEPTATPVPDAAATLISPVGGTTHTPAATRKPAAASQADGEVPVPGTIPAPSAQPETTTAPQATPETAPATAESAAQQNGEGGLPILPIAAGVVVLAIIAVVVIRRLFF